MKTFLKLTALFEALTGLALIFVPKLVILLLFEVTLDGFGGQIAGMIAGAAILSIAIICWLMKEVESAIFVVKTLLFYNISIVAIVLYSIINYGVKGPGIYLIVGFHTIFSIWSLLLFLKKSETV
ncbi:hypothetical protein [Flavobacterium sp. N3904]|uniref:hypothetical protein n=1 Tax=Flavobacterium sp. N3904 TaxID=2986835 RepID=UPI0022253392|nr:hypothetical protein [Flavobacterium sp. N3904]